LASQKKSSAAFEAALRRELRVVSFSNTPECIAPEILAAYCDRSLSRGERARVDSHLISCPRCQSMMASIARADDPDRSIAPEGSRSIFWITRLLAPVAMVGVVIALAIAMRTREQQAPEVIALASPAALPATEMAARAQSAPPMPGAPPAANGPAAKMMDAPRRKENALTMRTESLEVSGAMRAPNVASGSALSGAANSMAKEPPPMMLIASRDGSVAWRFGADGALARSQNSGPWLAQRSGVTTDLLAASAPSNDVCWMVGKSGTIVRTLDSGAHWRIINPPSRDDFTSIAATDSNNATAIASNGQRFVTHDGGVTWLSR
jgi:hypothetical protein